MKKKGANPLYYFLTVRVDFRLHRQPLPFQAASKASNLAFCCAEATASATRVSHA